MIRISMRALLATMSLSVFAATADAQRYPDTKGFFFGAAANATSIKFDETAFSDDRRENGYGLNLGLGYNFTRNLGLTFSITGASINDSGTDDFDVAHADLGARVSFPGRSALVPYIELSLAALAAEYVAEGTDVELEGGGLSGGVGLNYFFSRRLALDLNFHYTAGELSDGEIDGRDIDTNDVSFNTTRLNLGIAFYL